MKPRELMQIFIDFVSATGIAATFWYFQQTVPEFLRGPLCIVGLIFLFIGVILATSDQIMLNGSGLGLVAIGSGLVNSPVQFNSGTFFSVIAAIVITIIVSLVSFIRPSFNNTWRHLITSLVLSAAVCFLFPGFSITHFIIMFFLFLVLSIIWNININSNFFRYYSIMTSATMFFVTIGLYCLQNGDVILAAFSSK